MKQRLFLKPAIVDLFIAGGITSFVPSPILVKTETLSVFDQNESGCFADDTPTSNDVNVLVCQTCRRTDMPDQAARPCAQAKLDNAELPAGMRVLSIDYLSNCKNGYTIVLRAAAR